MALRVSTPKSLPVACRLTSTFAPPSKESTRRLLTFPVSSPICSPNIESLPSVRPFQIGSIARAKLPLSSQLRHVRWWAEPLCSPYEPRTCQEQNRFCDNLWQLSMDL